MIYYLFIISKYDEKVGKKTYRKNEIKYALTIIYEKIKSHGV